MSNIPIFLSCDNNYSPFVAATIASICDNTKSNIDFNILDGGIDDINKQKILQLRKSFNNFSIEFIKVDLEKEFQNFKMVTYISKAMYSRFLIPYVKPDIKKAIYLDIDLIVLKDISSFYNIDLEGYALGAIYDESHKDYNKDDPIVPSDKYYYFNSGVLLLDCEIWRKNNIIKDLFYLEKIYRKINLHPDEAILNKFFDRNYKMIPRKYNFIDYYYQKAPLPKDDIVIRHYATEFKPWKFDNTLKNDDILKFIDTRDIDIFWNYAKMTEFVSDIKAKCKYKTVKDLYKYKVYTLLQQKAKKGEI